MTLRFTVRKWDILAGSTECLSPKWVKRSKFLMSFGGQAPEPMPCVESLKRTFSLAYDRLTLAGERPVLATDTVMTQSYKCQVLSSLLDEAESRSKGKAREMAFPVSEAAAQLARLKAQEKRLLEADVEVTDAQIAELSVQLRHLEKSRKELLAQGMSPPVRFFMETVPGKCWPKDS
eukprot:symbB.v1.2.018400.t1/scaffold1435.1/size118962/5